MTFLRTSPGLSTSALYPLGIIGSGRKPKSITAEVQIKAETRNKVVDEYTRSINVSNIKAKTEHPKANDQKMLEYIPLLSSQILTHSERYLPYVTQTNDAAVPIRAALKIIKKDINPIGRISKVARYAISSQNTQRHADV